MGQQNVSRINHANRRKGPQTSPESSLLEALGHERDRAQRRFELVQRVVEQRDQLVEQVDAIRELSERLMEEDERKQKHIAALEAILAVRDGRIGELEVKVQAQSTRLQELERTLSVLAEADEKLDSPSR
ncbi:MAG: hypothetical protein JST54_22515 [Deltaproteobacteria bacterium]|nr:hypothetical protein [Deltaproteobacteria bacterium]